MNLNENALNFAKIILKHHPKSSGKHHHHHGSCAGHNEEKEDPLARVPTEIRRNGEVHSKNEQYSINYEDKW